MKAVTIAGLVLLIVGLCNNARGEIPTARAGDRIRIKVEHQESHFYGTRTVTSGWISGILVSLNPDSLGLSLDRSADTFVVRRESIVAAEKSIGIETHEDTGQWLGLLGGIAGGVAVGTGLAIKSDDVGNLMWNVPAGAVVGARAGLKAGGEVGRGMKHDHWEAIQQWPGTPFRCRIRH